MNIDWQETERCVELERVRRRERQRASLAVPCARDVIGA